MYEYLEYLTAAFIPGFIALDLVYRRRAYASPRGWRVRASAVTIGTFFLSGWVAAFWGWLFDGVGLFNGARLGTLGGAATGLLIYELVHYWYHRAAHTWNWLWRAAHQMHHSAESLDAFGANYLHPLDAALFATWASLVFFPVLGLTAEAGVLAALFLTFNAMFQHANIATPHWLGYLIQRPESHAIHHARGVHRYNYSDLPLWDIAFGTFRNPRSVEAVAPGFYEGASGRLFDMLVGRDVSEPHPRREVPAVVAVAADDLPQRKAA
jgi:sterol desaturase/sphingolipid hydroxylase (fatty acid hydroxylase superfamily)